MKKNYLYLYVCVYIYILWFLWYVVVLICFQHLKECSPVVTYLCCVNKGLPIFWQLMQSGLFPTVFRRQNVPDQKPEYPVPCTSPASAWRPVLLRAVVPSVRCTPLSRLSLLGCGRIYSRTSLLSSRILPLLLYPFSPCRSFCGV